MTLTRRCPSEEATREWGATLAGLLAPGWVVGLTGTLGSGKTALTRGIAAALGVAETEVVSPTFTLCVPYSGRLRVLHMDAYRIAHLEELDELGLDEQVEMGNVLICEWVERIRPGLPDLDLLIEATPDGETVRQFTLTGVSPRGRDAVQDLMAHEEATSERGGGAV